MTDKTAMQEMIEWIDIIDNSVFALSAPSNELRMLSNFKRKATELLELEMEQIFEAFVAGDERGTKEIPFNCEQYYNQTYKQKL